MDIYTSEQLEKLEIEEFESITESCMFSYQLTAGELGWLDWIGDRYAIATCIWENIADSGLLTCDVHDIAIALAADGVDRAPCLSEDTQLARLIWFIGPAEADYS